MGWLDGIRDWLLAPVLSRMNTEDRGRVQAIHQARQYRIGQQREMLKVAQGQTNDNVVMNFAGLAVDRGVSLLFGHGVQFNLPGDGQTPEAQYFRAVMDANKQQILLHRLGIYGAEAGTCYLWFLLNGVVGKDGLVYPRLVAIDPEYVTIETEAEDVEIVRRYLVQYPVSGPDGKLALRKKVVERDDGDGWVTRDFLVQDGGEVCTGYEAWPYDFPPILHWQNLPGVGSAYGQADVTADVIRLQDRINFTGSNIAKIIRIYANPQRFSRMGGQDTRIEVGPDRMPNFNDPNGGIFQLDALGDLAAALAFYDRLVHAIFAVTRTVDPSDTAAKLGDLTNFGLRVLYQDALQKLGTKRELYGDALLEMGRRLLVIGGFTNTDMGTLIWPDALPENQQDLIEGLKFDLDNRLVSRQTVAQRRGYDWDLESQRMDAERVRNENDLALALLEQERQGRLSFDRGVGADLFPGGSSGEDHISRGEV